MSESNAESAISGTKPLDVRSTLREGIARLESNRIPSAPLAAELLLMHVLGRDRTWLYTHPEAIVRDHRRQQYLSLIEQRASGVPVQHLTGRQEFWGLDFEVTPDVLIPRPETEHVVEVALQRAAALAKAVEGERNPSLRIADVGTGSGCIAIALAHELPTARIVATDISPSALAVAYRNAVRHGVESRIEVLKCNLLDGVEREPKIGKRFFDIIVSNPPYIGRNEAAGLPVEVAKHEPELALFGGELGYELYEPLIQRAAQLLDPGGALVLELGHQCADYVLHLLNSTDWTDVAITNDLAGIRRVASAIRSASSDSRQAF